MVIVSRVRDRAVLASDRRLFSRACADDFAGHALRTLASPARRARLLSVVAALGMVGSRSRAGIGHGRASASGFVARWSPSRDPVAVAWVGGVVFWHFFHRHQPSRPPTRRKLTARLFVNGRGWSETLVVLAGRAAVSLARLRRIIRGPCCSLSLHSAGAGPSEGGWGGGVVRFGRCCFLAITRFRFCGCNTQIVGVLLVSR